MAKAASSVVNFVISPLSVLVGGKAGQYIRAAVLTVGGAVLGNPALMMAGISMGISTATAPSGSAAGSQTDITLDPQAGIPYVIGRTYTAGTLVHQDTFGSDNKFIGSVLVYSGAGPVQEFEAFQVDRQTVSFPAGAASGTYSGFMWLASQLGTTPQASALASSQGTLPGWGAANKLSGYCAALVTMKFDKKGKQFAAGYPQIGAIIKGVKVYDPRLDSTYPGGSGSCRSDDETTWAYSQNPWLHALTFAIGRHQNGKRVAGVGMPIDSIDVAAFVEAANVADANSWTCGGVISSLDSKWDALKMMAQAGGGQPIRLGGTLSCDFQTTRVPLATVTSSDIIGDARVVATQARRDRFNTVIPRCRLETHGWEVTALDEISVSSYVTEDGDTRSREIDLHLVQNKDQAAQLATYEIVNAREFGPISLRLKPKWVGFKPGDALTLTISELGLSSQLAVITKRSPDPETGEVSLELRSETTSKHAFALGKTGTAPTTPSLTPTDLSTVAAPTTWSATGTTLSGADGSIPALVVTGATTDNLQAEAVVFEYRVDGTTEWISAGVEDAATTKKEITAVTPGTAYDVAVSYLVRGVKSARQELGPVTAGDLFSSAQVQLLIAASGVSGLDLSATDAGATATITVQNHDRLYPDKEVAVNGGSVAGLAFATEYGIYYDDAGREGGAVTYGATTTLLDSVNSPANPNRHHVGRITTPANGGGATYGSGPAPGGGSGGSGVHGGGDVSPY